MVNFKEIYHFSRFQWGPNIFQGGGVQLLPWGVQLLIPHITCDFPGGGSGPSVPPPPPSGSALEGDQVSVSGPSGPLVISIQS